MRISSVHNKIRAGAVYCQRCIQRFLLKLIQFITFRTIYRYWHHSIQRQLVLGIALVHAVLMTIFIVDLTEQQRSFLREEAIKQAFGLTETLAANSSSWTLANDVVGLSEILRHQLHYPGLQYALVVSMRGQVLAHTDEQWLGKYLEDEISQVLFSQKISSQHTDTQLLFQNSEFLDVAAPILSAERIIGWVRVGISTKQTEESLKLVTKDGLLYTLIAISVGIIFAILMARGLTKGLNNLMLVIERVKLGERDVEADETREDEIGYLAKGFNAMLRAIKDSDYKMREAKQAAETANLAKSQFIANVSHELRTPLNAVIGYSEILQDEFEELTIEEIHNDLERINTSGKHLLNLINDVLDLSKIESGKMEIFNETFDVIKMVKEVLTTVEVLIKRKNNCLEFQYDSRISLMYADLTKTRQILLNLLSNASKFTESGVIYFTIAQFERDKQVWINFIIEDTGIGIDVEKQRDLFRPFQQVDGSTTRKYGGTGLGLVISKRFAEMMGGNITLESELGKGTKFTVCLPTKRNIIGSNKPAPMESSVTDDKQPTILVIDDDSDVRELLTKHLHKSNYRVVTAEDGQKGLQLAQQLLPDAITLDVMMPGMDGWMVLSELKKNKELQNIPVIMLSMVENRELGYALGAADYLLKPLDKQKVLEVLFKYQCPDKKNYVIMVVEDDAITQDLTQEMLHRHGWQVMLANNGKNALKLLEKQLPDLIMLDLMMPEMDGITFVKELRQHPKWRDIPVIVLTAKDVTQADRNQLMDRVNAVFQKGAYQRDDLLTQLEELLISSERRKH